jgi:hypothetical protein
VREEIAKNPNLKQSDRRKTAIGHWLLAFGS